MLIYRSMRGTDKEVILFLAHPVTRFRFIKFYPKQCLLVLIYQSPLIDHPNG